MNKNKQANKKLIVEGESEPSPKTGFSIDADTRRTKNIKITGVTNTINILINQLTFSSNEKKNPTEFAVNSGNRRDIANINTIKITSKHPLS